MSARVPKPAPVRGNQRNGSRSKLNVDLNEPLPASEYLNGEGASSHPPSPQQPSGGDGPSTQQVQGDQNPALAFQLTIGGQQGAPSPVAIDVDTLDDDVVFSTPRAFAEAKQNSRRNQGRTIIDVESEESARHAANNRNKRPRTSCISVETYETHVLQRHVISVSDATRSRSATRFEQPPPPPPPPETSFSCPVCMGPLVEEMTTKCGHIFCKECIRTAIAAQKKCPTCRRKLTMRDIIRIYLPSTS